MRCVFHRHYNVPAMASLKRRRRDRAGVSVATASRVATGSTYVRPETRDRVERAMRELLYVPPGRATDSGAIGLLVPEFANPVFAALAQALETRRHERRVRGDPLQHERLGHARGPATSTCCSSAGSREWCSSAPRSPTSAATTRHYAQLARAGGAARLRQRWPRRRRRRRPSASTSVPPGASPPSICSSSATGEIGFVAGEVFAQATREKLMGRDDALLDAGIEPNGAVAHAGFTVDGGRQALRSLMRRARAPPDRRHLLERPDGDRRDARGGRARVARSRRPLDRRLRRDRRRHVDATAADDGRAADRRHRRDGDRAPCAS